MSTPLQAIVNEPYPNRIQLICGSWPPPWNNGLRAFDPTIDLQVYVDGDVLPIVNFSYETNNNRYLLYSANPFNLQGVIQVVYHIPLPPFFSG